MDLPTDQPTRGEVSMGWSVGRSFFKKKCFSWEGLWGGHKRSWGSHREVTGRSCGGRRRVVGCSVECFKYLPTRGVFRGVFFLKSVEILSYEILF